LYLAGLNTVRIGSVITSALRRPFVSDLMRLNKSFIVKRSCQMAIREMNGGFFGQSIGYITLFFNAGPNLHLWIAQKEGRAKDGLDQNRSCDHKCFYIEPEQREKTVCLKPWRT